jgi:hypothetical protein
LHAGSLGEAQQGPVRIVRQRARKAFMMLAPSGSPRASPDT